MIDNWVIHPVADLFPLIEGDEFAQLVDDVREHGVREPVWLHPDGRIIDGRNRARAAVEAGVDLPTRVWDGSGSLVQFVLSLNLHRRHLTSSQKAVLALEVEPILAEEAKQRQRHGGPEAKGSQIVDYVDSNEGKAAEQAAQLVGTNRQYVADAKRVAQERPDLIEQVRDGAITIPQAVRETKGAHVANNSGDNEWYTPVEYVEAARRAMGEISLDPASSVVAQENVSAKHYFTKDDDGLAQEWFGHVWLNPPYAQPLIGHFVDKVCVSYKDAAIESAIVLVNNGTETVWGQRLLDCASAVLFPKSRIRFLKPDGVLGAPLQGQMIVYIGESSDAFAREFEQFGVVLRG